MWPQSSAEMMKKHAGKPWRPSNGTEGMIFMDNVCAACRIGAGNCIIIPEIMAHSLDSENYPDAWYIGECGYPQCKSYDPKTDQTRSKKGASE